MPIPSKPDFLESVIGTSADVLPIPAQDYTDPTQNGALNYATGWPAITSLPLEAGGKAPRREYFNALAQLLSSHIFFQQSGSVYPWSATLDYLTGSHVLGSDGKEYIAQKSNGPDVPDSSAVDPVGDESGTWLPAGSVYASLATADTPGIMRPDGETCTVVDGVLSSFAASYNTRLVLTESDPAWTSPVTGWARVTVIGGGGGGAGGHGGSFGVVSGGGGDSGEYSIQFIYLQKGATYSVVIGAGGAAGVDTSSSSNQRGGNGGQSRFHMLTASGGLGGFYGQRASDMLPDSHAFAFLGQSGSYTWSDSKNTNIEAWGGVGGGAGYGRGGIGSSVKLNNNTTVPSAPGTQGAVIIEYYDPDKEDA